MRTALLSIAASLSLGFGLLSGDALGQQPTSEAAPSAQNAIAPSAGGPVTLDVVVTDGRKGKPVASLPESSFTLLDRGAPRPLQSFRALTGAADPVKVLIVVDAVNIDFQRLAYERQEITRFLKSNDGRLAEPTALAIVTDTSVSIEPGYSTDGRMLADAFNKQAIGLRILRRSSGFFGAAERLDLSLKALNQFVARAEREPGRKFIIWMTPGWPLLSGPGAQFTKGEQSNLFHQVIATSDTLRRSRITLYTVDPLGAGEDPGRTFYFQGFLKGAQRPSDAYPADLGAQVLSIQSGGLFLSGSNDVARLLGRCFDDASVAYELTFQPTPADAPDEFHKIEIRMADPRLAARTRQGYYAQP